MSFIVEYNAGGIDFSLDDLMQLLDKQDPRELPAIQEESPHIVELPNSPDLILRWTDGTRTARCFPIRGKDVARHAQTHAQRLGDLANRGIVVPAHRSFCLERCPRLQRPVVYSVTERLTNIRPMNTMTTDPKILTHLGHTLLDAHQAVPVGEHRCWDDTKLQQYNLLPDNTTVALLDIDTFLTRDPRAPYHRLVLWAQHITEHDGGVLMDRIHTLKEQACAAYEQNTNNCQAPIW